MKRFLVVLSVLAVSLSTTKASAQAPDVQGPVSDAALVSVERVSLAAGLNYLWYAAPFDASAPVPAFPRGFEVGLYGAYNLTPKLSLTASTAYMPDNKQLEQRVGLRLRLFRGRP